MVHVAVSSQKPHNILTSFPNLLYNTYTHKVQFHLYKISIYILLLLSITESLGHVCFFNVYLGAI